MRLVSRGPSVLRPEPWGEATSLAELGELGLGSLAEPGELGLQGAKGELGPQVADPMEPPWGTNHIRVSQICLS